MEKELRKNVNTHEKVRDKVPFTVFVCKKTNMGDIQDYKHVFNDIISDRIQEKYK